MQCCHLLQCRWQHAFLTVRSVGGGGDSVIRVPFMILHMYAWIHWNPSVGGEAFGMRAVACCGGGGEGRARTHAPHHSACSQRKNAIPPQLLAACAAQRRRLSAHGLLRGLRAYMRACAHCVLCALALTTHACFGALALCAGTDRAARAPHTLGRPGFTAAERVGMRLIALAHPHTPHGRSWCVCVDVLLSPFLQRIIPGVVASVCSVMCGVLRFSGHRPPRLRAATL